MPPKGGSRKRKPAEALIPPADKKSYMRQWREERSHSSETEKWARLELELGRFAQGSSLIIGFILGMTAYVASIFSATVVPFAATLRRPEMLLWLPPLLASVILAVFTVIHKWQPYRSGYKSAHFLSSVVAVVVSVLLFVLMLLDYAYVINLEPAVTWMYPGSMLGISIAFVSIALTWEGYGWRKAASIIFSLAATVSLLPLPFLYAGATDFGSLQLVYTYNGLFIVVAGSMLHLIASSADATQREILKASDTKITSLKQEMMNRLGALEYREKAYLERDAHLDAKERNILTIEAELNERSAELNQTQTKLEAQDKNLRDIEARVGKMRAEVEAKVEELRLKDADQKSIRAEVETAKKGLQEREASLAEREKELKRSQIDVASRERGLEAKATEIADAEMRMKVDDEALETRREEVIRLQKELELKESEVNLKLEELEVQQSAETLEKIAELKDWEEKVLAKERAVGALEVQMRSQQEEMLQRIAELEAREASVLKERASFGEREQDLVAREKELSDRDAATAERAAELERQWAEMQEVEKRLASREEEYNARFKDAKLKEADFATASEEATRRVSALNSRETKLTEWQQNLKEETQKLDQKYRELLAREKEIEAKESDLSLKELEMTEKEREEREVTRTPGIKDVDAQQALEMAEKRLQEREEEFKRRAYQREKELEAREAALREQLKAMVPEAEALEAGAEATQAAGSKVKTGTPRLDDLLYGGVPMNANILFVGPAFVGKEVAILNFVAEGLKSNAPAVIITTSKPPVEIAKEMAPVLPTFMEYERLGLVRWIDASGTTPTTKLTKDGVTYRIPNASDFDALIAAVNEADEEFRGKGSPYFRLAFMSLSSPLSQTEKKAALSFVQRFVNNLRQTKCVAAFALERGMHTDQEVESLQQLMDGAMFFRQDKAKTMLSVIGIGEVQTRDWVPYRFTNKALMIGSFQLERIR